MICLDNLVGVDKRCSDVVSLSGKYLNDLPSFSLKIAAATMGSETAGPVQFANQMLELAQDDISEKFREHLQPYMKATTVISNRTAGEYPLRRATEAQTKQGGWRVKIKSNDYLRFDLHSITLFWNTTATVDVKVFNLLTGNLLDTFSVDMVANTPTEEIVAKTYSGNNILLGIVTEGSGQPFRVTNGGCTSCGHKINYAHITPGEIDVADPMNDANFDGTTYSYGMQLNYSVSCDVEPFICNMSPQLWFALREKAAAHVHTAVIGEQERWNTYVTVERKKSEFWQQYHEGRYEESMKSLLNNMSIPECVCFYCDSFVKKRIQVP